MSIAILNPKNDQSFSEWFMAYNQSQVGVSHTLSVVNKSAKVGKGFFESPTLGVVEKGSAGALETFKVLSLAGSTLDAYRSIQELSQAISFGSLKNFFLFLKV